MSNVPEAIVFAGNQQFSCAVFALTEDGALLGPPQPLPTKTYLRINLALPHNDEMIDVDAIAVAEGQHRGRYAVRVMFHQVSVSSTREIAVYVHARRTGETPVAIRRGPSHSEPTAVVTRRARPAAEQRRRSTRHPVGETAVLEPRRRRTVTVDPPSLAGVASSSGNYQAVAAIKPRRVRDNSCAGASTLSSPRLDFAYGGTSLPEDAARWAEQIDTLAENGKASTNSWA